MDVNDTLIRMEFYNYSSKEWRGLSEGTYSDYPYARKEFERCNRQYPEYTQRFVDNQTNETIVYYIGTDTRRRPPVD